MPRPTTSHIEEEAWDADRLRETHARARWRPGAAIVETVARHVPAGRLVAFTTVGGLGRRARPRLPAGHPRAARAPRPRARAAAQGGQRPAAHGRAARGDGGPHVERRLQRAHARGQPAASATPSTATAASGRSTRRSPREPPGPHVVGSLVLGGRRAGRLHLLPGRTPGHASVRDGRGGHAGAGPVGPPDGIRRRQLQGHRARRTTPGFGPAGSYTLSLWTTRQPYAVTIAVTDPAKPFEATDLSGPATLLLGTVTNLDAVHVTVQGRTYSLTAREATATLGHDVKTLGTDRAALDDYLRSLAGLSAPGEGDTPGGNADGRARLARGGPSDAGLCPSQDGLIGWRPSDPIQPIHQEVPTMRSRFTLTALLAALVAVVLTACSSGSGGGSDLESVKQAGVLRVATEGTYSPFSFHDPKTNALTGYDVEVAKAVADKLGVKVRVRRDPVGRHLRRPRGRPLRRRRQPGDEEPRARRPLRPQHAPTRGPRVSSRPARTTRRSPRSRASRARSPRRA